VAANWALMSPRADPRHLGMILQVKKESLFQLTTEWLPDMMWIPRFEARNPPRDGTARNLEEVDAPHPCCCHSFPMPRTKNANVPRIKASNEEVNLHGLDGSIADVERNGKVGGRPHSKIPSMFDHRVLDSSTIESYYHLPIETTGNWAQGSKELAPMIEFLAQGSNKQ